MGRSS
jgi:hypothetical protein